MNQTISKRFASQPRRRENAVSFRGGHRVYCLITLKTLRTLWRRVLVSSGTRCWFPGETQVARRFPALPAGKPAHAERERGRLQRGAIRLKTSKFLPTNYHASCPSDSQTAGTNTTEWLSQRRDIRQISFACLLRSQCFADCRDFSSMPARATSNESRLGP